MSQSIGLILTSNVQPGDIESCLRDKFDYTVMTNMGKGLTIQVAERDKFGVTVNYVTVSELNEMVEDYEGNELLDPALVADLDGHVFYHLTFNDRRLLDAVLEQLLRNSGTNLKRTWIDNDLGVVLPAAVAFEHGDWKQQRPASDSVESRCYQRHAVTDFSKYHALKDNGKRPFEVYASAKMDGLDEVATMLVLREVFDLSLVDARKVSHEVNEREHRVKE
jgi:hypothetical protein